MYNGFKFGFIDNAIVAISAIIGINMNKFFGYNLGAQSALYGALIGHTFSDMFAGYFDFGWRIALNMAFGCLSVTALVYIYFTFIRKDDNKNKQIF